MLICSNECVDDLSANTWLNVSNTSDQSRHSGKDLPPEPPAIAILTILNDTNEEENPIFRVKQSLGLFELKLYLLSSSVPERADLYSFLDRGFGRNFGPT